MRRYVLIALLCACKSGASDSPEAAKSEPVTTTKVRAVTATKAPTPVVLTITGTIAADERSEVTADTQGKVITVKIERGDQVKLGQSLIWLDVRSAQMSAREAQANLSAARAQKDLADQECARTKKLMDSGAITASEYDRQMTQCRASQDQVAATQARVEMMAKSVSDGVVRAPFDGVVAERAVSPGEWVQPGKPLFTLVKTDPLKIELSVPEKAVRLIKLGQDVQVVPTAHSDQIYAAKVTRIGAEIGRTRSLIVEAQLAKTTELVPGMFAEARIVLAEEPQIVLPRTAVVKNGKTSRVFVIKNGELEEHIVQLGTPPAPDQESIVRGLAEKDRVVANATKELEDGQKVAE